MQLGASAPPLVPGERGTSKLGRVEEPDSVRSGDDNSNTWTMTLILKSGRSAFVDHVQPDVSFFVVFMLRDKFREKVLAHSPLVEGGVIVTAALGAGNEIREAKPRTLVFR
jgi:hypothetical protein